MTIDDEMKREMAADAEAAAAAPMERLRPLLDEVLLLDRDIETLDETLKEKKARREQLLRHEVPGLMSEIGIAQATIDVGNALVDVRVDVKVFGTLRSAPDQDDAVAYLEENGFEGGVLTRASIDFKEEEMTDEVRRSLEGVVAQGYEKDVHFARELNPSTLRAFVRQAIAENPSFDPSRVGATVVRQAIVKPK